MKLLDIGDKVIVAEPRPNDLWRHSFAGVIVDLGEGVVSVIDQDENIFDMAANQIVLNDEYKEGE